MKISAQMIRQWMEDQWNRPRCAAPLQIARWAIGYTGLRPDNKPFIPDGDDGDPVDAEDSV